MSQSVRPSRSFTSNGQLRTFPWGVHPSRRSLSQFSPSDLRKIIPRWPVAAAILAQPAFLERLCVERAGLMGPNPARVAAEKNIADPRRFNPVSVMPPQPTFHGKTFDALEAYYKAMSPLRVTFERKHARGRYTIQEAPVNPSEWRNAPLLSYQKEVSLDDRPLNAIRK